MAARTESTQPSPNDPKSFASRLKRQYGEGVDPEVSLDQAASDAPSTAPSSASNELLQRLSDHSLKESRYKLLGEIGRGGMGAILKVWDEDLRRTLAMKVILGNTDTRAASPPASPAASPPGSPAAPPPNAPGHAPNRVDTPAVDARTLGRFLEEAQVTGQLDHPGIAPVHELGLDSDGRVYFTMKLVKGRDLKHIFDLVFESKEGWNETRALSVMLKVCEAMAYAHTKGVIHRDLKPANVMVGGFGEVYVMDWGLARVLGRKDTHDIRLKPEFAQSLTSVKTERRDEREDALDSPLVTMDGDVMGTPAYMPPEQARGEIEKLSARSDVYALGAMLYHLLARRMPYVPPGARVSNRTVLAMVIQGPPTALTSLRKDVPAELAAICDKAMSREAAERYPDTLALAEDLRAYLEHRVVGAYETGAVAELKKWVERNKPLALASAAAVLLLVGGLVVSSTLYAKADENARVAKQNEERADAKSREAEVNARTAQAEKERAEASERFATQRANDVLSLSAGKDLDDLVARADKLWPAHPEIIGEYDRWLADARELIDGRAADPEHGLKARPSLAQHQAKLAEIRAQALPQTDAERRAERESHPRFAELSSTQSELTWHSRMLGLEPWPTESEVEAALASESLPTDANALNTLAWTFVDPAQPVYGSEVKALILARRAVAAATEAERGGIRDSLAWAYFRLGRFDEALAEERRALDEVDDSKKKEFEGYVAKIEKSIASWRGAESAKRRERREALVTEVAELQRVVDERRTWEFSDPEAGWWQVQLSKLVSSLEALRDPTRGLMGDNVAEPYGWGVTKRNEFARTIRERSVDGPDAKTRWDEAIAAIAVSQQYHALELTPQLGLLPISADPESGLWEFAHLQTGEPAQRGADGKLMLTKSMGLVLVLIPGGTFAMGAQKTDPSGPNYDPEAASYESPVHEVALTAYFLSKYEMTQGQWQRFTGRNPSQYSQTNFRTSWNRARKDWTALHPVEQVTWTECMEVMTRLGLVLPSEAQWEHGARAGTTTVYWSGDQTATMQDAGNVADGYAKGHGGAGWSVIHESWDDGQSVHAEVGTYRANAFGLHDVHGNMWEWCRDGFADYSLAKELDPLAPSSGAQYRVSRGGGFDNAASYARCASRSNGPPEYQSNDLGLRPARASQLAASLLHPAGK